MNYKELFKDLKFDRKEHTYWLKDKMLVGVSTVLDQKNKPFLIAWAVKEMAKYLEENWDIKKKYSQIEKGNLIKEAKGAYRRKSENALDSGKIAHDWIEKYIAGKSPEKPKDEKSLNAINAFLKWEKYAKPIWLASELKVYSRDCEYAGTLDFIAKIDDKIYLGDFKTSNRISNEYALQTAAYQNCLSEKGVKIDGRIIIRLDKDTGEYQEYYIPTDYEFDLNVFLSLKQVHKWNVYNNNLEQKV